MSFRSIAVLVRQPCRFFSPPNLARLALFIDEHGKSQGQQDLDRIIYDKSKWELTCVSVSAGTDLPVFRLLPKGLAYQRMRRAHSAQVEAKRAAKVKQVRFRSSMAPHDFAVHVERLKEFCGERGLRCLVTCQAVSKGNGMAEERKNIGEDLSGKVIKAIEEFATAESLPSFDSVRNQCTFYIKSKHK